jgi:ArsR family transcriptional regulator
MAMRDELASRRCSQYMRALADPERLRIVQCLRDGPLAVGEIAARLGSPMANVSHHLKQLRVAGLISGRKLGRHVVYGIAARVLRRKDPATGSPAVVAAPVAGAVARRADVLDFGCCRLELGPGQ